MAPRNSKAEKAKSGRFLHELLLAPMHGLSAQRGVATRPAKDEHDNDTYHSGAFRPHFFTPTVFAIPPRAAQKTNTYHAYKCFHHFLERGKH